MKEWVGGWVSEWRKRSVIGLERDWRIGWMSDWMVG